MTLFGNDRVLMYDCDPWNRLGFGVPNFGSPSPLAPGTIDTIGTLNQALWGLHDEIGKQQLFVMTHVDAYRTQPPSVNTIMRLGKMLNRVRSVFAGRMRDTNDQLVEPGHQRPAIKIWNMHPVPYFQGPFVRNHWMSEYNDLTMTALTNFMQHSDNNLSMTVTKKFAQDIYQYFGEIKRLVGVELLGLPVAEVSKEDFLFTDTHYQNYHPDAVTMNIEALDGPGNMASMPTEVDLYPLLKGIPADMIYPLLKQYPVVPVMAGADLAGADTIDANKSTAGTGGVGGAGATAIGPGGSPGGTTSGGSQAGVIGAPTI